MIYFLDTNIIIYAKKGIYPEIKKHFRQIPSQSILIPAVVRAELEYGARKSSDYEKTINEYLPFLNTFLVADFGADAVREYGKIRAYLETNGTPIGGNDMLIASIVKSMNGTLVTHNIKEFSRIPGLLLEDWTVG